MSVPRRIAAFLDLAAADAAAAAGLASLKNRYAAYHCQQAIEKLAKAILLHRGMEAGIEHHLDALIARLPATDPWKARLKPFESYSPFATTSRYPSPGGSLSTVPKPEVVGADAAKIDQLIKDARRELIVS